MSAIPGDVTFKSDLDLLDFADLFLGKCRISSLEYDVKRCMKKYGDKYAPVLALMYCLSVIDLMGSLMEGHAIKGNTTRNSLHMWTKL